MKLHTLKSGIRVLCDSVPGYETFALSVVAGRGARYESPERSGWSHLLEHMVFKGAGERSSKSIVEAIEAEGGSINASTGYERTSFQVRGLVGSLPLAVATLADLVLRPTLDAADLAKEKHVVGQEIAEAADTPDDFVFEMAQVAAWGDHAIGRPVLGTVESLEPAAPASLGAWRSEVYAPDRLIVAAAGAVDEDELLRLTEAAFADAAGVGPALGPVPSFQGERITTLRKLEQAHIVLMLPGMGATDPDAAAFRLLAEALGGGMSSRLFQEAREARGLAYAIDAYADTHSDAGAFGVYAGCAAADAKPLAELVAVEIRKMTDGLPEAELSRCKALHKASLFFSRESMTARAEHGAHQLLLYGALQSAARIAERIDAVTSDAVAAVAQRILEPRQAAASVLGSKRAGAAAAAFAKAMF